MKIFETKKEIEQLLLALVKKKCKCFAMLAIKRTFASNNIKKADGKSKDFNYW